MPTPTKKKKKLTTTKRYRMSRRELDEKLSSVADALDNLHESVYDLGAIAIRARVSDILDAAAELRDEVLYEKG
jgi:hypothetical protein